MVVILTPDRAISRIGSGGGAGLARIMVEVAASESGPRSAVVEVAEPAGLESSARSPGTGVGVGTTSFSASVSGVDTGTLVGVGVAGARVGVGERGRVGVGVLVGGKVIVGSGVGVDSSAGVASIEDVASPSTRDCSSKMADLLRVSSSQALRRNPAAITRPSSTHVLLIPRYLDMPPLRPATLELYTTHTGANPDGIVEYRPDRPARHTAGPEVLTVTPQALAERQF
ncbi:MAG: hypothetical protein O3A47_05005 [Chloroflexi bacterium]|nr:hypothetical protein [Chloroflexota bacterium]